MRWDEETGRVSIFRKPSNNANGNTRDRQGRLLTCEHDTRRVTRTKYDGSITVIADRYDGKPLNSPNDIVCKSDGSIWFTDPPFGILGNYEGHVAKPELPTNIYRVDASGRVSVATGDVIRPNGLCFSPDETKLYVIVAGATPRLIHTFGVTDKGTRLANRRTLLTAEPDGTPDGFRCDVDGNLWCRWGMGHGARGAGRCGDFQSRRQTHWPYRSARTLRQLVLRRFVPQPLVHDGQHLGLLALC